MIGALPADGVDCGSMMNSSGQKRLSQSLEFVKKSQCGALGVTMLELKMIVESSVIPGETELGQLRGGR